MRLIDSDELLKPVGSYERVKYTYEYGDAVTVEDIELMPTIDAEPVIRCKDCKWFGTHTGWKGNRFSVCRNVTGGMAYIKAYDYCSRAERKDG